ncbi:hypothetical protein [Chryseobacterium taichungense]|uniref:hypothetical protein n=1 Tax=Chryseobacterium taichungense TaxID=295069 RepID=UPI0028B21F52|nr:hypothetical protein [Chryseobacterium taichungense]
MAAFFRGQSASEISSGTLQKLRINGTLSYIRVGGTLYYNYKDIEEMLKKKQ